MNPRNFGVFSGRLTKDPVVFTNSDGSRKVIINVAARDNFKTGNEYASQFMDFTAFIPANKAKSIYDYLTKGSAVTVLYSLRNYNYTNAEGIHIYGVETRVENLDVTDNQRKQATPKS